MNCSILAIGTELLLGSIENTNASFIAGRLAENGIDSFLQVTVGDNEKRIHRALEFCLSCSDVVIITGGLGSTEDDVTSSALSSFFHRELVLDKEIESHLEERFTGMDRAVYQRIKKQAYILEGSRIIQPMGTAPGLVLEEGDKLIICLPGVPGEMRFMMEKSVLPLLVSRGKDSQGVIISRFLRIVGLSEPAIETAIMDIVKGQQNPTLAMLPGLGEVQIRLTARARSREEAQELLGTVEKQIKQRLSNKIFGIDEEDLEKVVGDMCRKEGLSLSAAESCTGGLFSSRITSVSGSSDYFRGSVVSYSNESKERILGVRSSSLRSFGAVSKEVAEEMARGAKNLFATDIAVSCTGTAGPKGGTEEKPVGLVFIGLCSDSMVVSERMKYYGTRKDIQYRATQSMLDLIRRFLLGEQLGGRGN